MYYPVFYRFGSLNSKETEVFEKSDSGEYEKDFKMKKNEANLNQRINHLNRRNEETRFGNDNDGITPLPKCFIVFWTAQF